MRIMVDQDRQVTTTTILVYEENDTFRLCFYLNQL